MYKYINIFLLLLCVALPSQVQAEKVIDLEKRLDTIHQQISDWNGEVGVLSSAIIELKSIIEANTKSARAYVEMARAVRKKGYVSGNNYRPEALAKAKKLLDKAMAIDPNSYWVWWQLSWYYMSSKNIMEAEKSIVRAKKIDSKNDLNLIVENQIYLLQKKWQKVIGNIEPLLDKKIDDKNIRQSLLVNIRDAYGAIKDYKNHEKIYKLIIEESGTAWSMGNYANFLMRHKRYDESILYAKKALAIMDYGKAREILGKALYFKGAQSFRKNKADKNAAQLFHEAIKYSPYNKNAAHALAIHNEKLAITATSRADHNKYKKEAIAWHEYTIKIAPDFVNAKKALEKIKSWR